MPTTMELPALHDRRLAAANEHRGLESSVCAVLACPNATSEGKPYCMAHLDRLPYVKRVKTELAQRDAEAAAALSRKRWRELDPTGSRAGELLEELALGGAQTVERLAVKLQIPVRAVLGYARSLEHAGLVRTIQLATERRGIRRVLTRTSAGAGMRSAS